MKWQLFIGHAIFLGSVLFTSATLLALKVLRKRRQRRSPLHGKSIGHLPGQQLLDRIRKADDEVAFSFDVMIIALPMLFLVWATLKIDWTQVRFGANEWIFVVGWVLFFGYGLWHFLRHSKRREQAQDGLLAERVTGMQLNRLMAQGCLVLHDLPCGEYNIDHVVVAPRGVFAVETKSFRKPRVMPAGVPAKVMFDGEQLKFSDFLTRKPIEQARRQAQSLAGILQASLGESIRVTPALALPGWWIEKTEAGKAANVFVFTPMGRGCEWFTYGDEVLSPAQRSLIAQALAMKYPPIAE